MDMRAEVWSPLQNAAVWMGAWLYGHEPTDNLLDAFTELLGPPRTASGEPFASLLAQVRQETNGLVDKGPGSPVIRLALSGPGEPPLLPAGSLSSQTVATNPYGALIISTDTPGRHLVLVPVLSPGEAARFNHKEHSHVIQWQLIEETADLPSPAWLSPGDADSLLTQATKQAANLIEATGYSTDTLPNPRLTVGTLADFYDTPGLPSCVPPRCAKLFARADTVAAIIETVTDAMGDHSLDVHLLPLWRHIRAARVAGVDYAVRDFAR